MQQKGLGEESRETAKPLPSTAHLAIASLRLVANINESIK